MKISKLLSLRQDLLRQAHLANLAFAYQSIGDFAARIARVGLRGRVRLKQADVEAERFWATLSAVDGSQAVLEEHFTEDVIMHLADVLAFVLHESDLDVTFRIEDLGDQFLPEIRRELEEAGVKFDDKSERIREPQQP